MEWQGYIRFALALIFVLALIGVLTALARRMGIGFRGPGRGPKGRRLAIVEVLALDPKRRLVLVRRDRTDHLLLLGGGTDVVVESVADDKPTFAAALGGDEPPATAGEGRRP